MTLDLHALVATAALALALGFLPGPSRMRRGGMSWGVGNRDRPPPDEPAWIGRCERAQKNLLENLPLFAALVLSAHVAGENDAITAYAALGFLAARITHAAVYLAGVTYVRTLAFYASLAAEAVILWRILT